MRPCLSLPHGIVLDTPRSHALSRTFLPRSYCICVSTAHRKELKFDPVYRPLSYHSQQVFLPPSSTVHTSYSQSYWSGQEEALEQNCPVTPTLAKDAATILLTSTSLNTVVSNVISRFRARSHATNRDYEHE